jgi:hypothetical protein
MGGGCGRGARQGAWLCGVVAGRLTRLAALDLSRNRLGAAPAPGPASNGPCEGGPGGLGDLLGAGLRVLDLSGNGLGPKGLPGLAAAAAGRVAGLGVLRLDGAPRAALRARVARGGPCGGGKEEKGWRGAGKHPGRGPAGNGLAVTG